MQDEPASLPIEQVARSLRAEWDLAVDDVQYAPVGGGSFHWIAYDRGKPRWFVTGDPLRGEETLARLTACYRAAWKLAEQGLEFVLAPVPDLTGLLVRRVLPTWALAVFPWIDGAAAGPGAWTDEAGQLEIAALLGRLHVASSPAAPLWAPGIPPTRAAVDLEAIYADVGREWASGPFAEQARHLLAASRSQVAKLSAHFVRLSDQLRADPEPWVVTHGEPHSANVLRDVDGRLWLIDWDTLGLAPRERDHAGLVGPAARAAYAAATGSEALRAYVVELFEAEWDLSEIGEYARQLYESHDGGADDQRAIADLAGYLEVSKRWPTLR